MRKEGEVVWGGQKSRVKSKKREGEDIFGDGRGGGRRTAPGSEAGSARQGKKIGKISPKPSSG
jgi:hypothetical protein